MNKNTVVDILLVCTALALRLADSASSPLSFETSDVKSPIHLRGGETDAVFVFAPNAIASSGSEYLRMNPVGYDDGRRAARQLQTSDFHRHDRDALSTRMPPTAPQLTGRPTFQSSAPPTVELTSLSTPLPTVQSTARATVELTSRETAQPTARAFLETTTSPTFDPTDAAAVTPSSLNGQKIEFHLGIFDLSLHFPFSATLDHGRTLLMEFDEFYLERVLEIHISEGIEGIYGYLMQVMIVVTRGEKRTEGNFTVVDNTFTGTAVFVVNAEALSRPTLLINQEDFHSALTELFVDGSFLTRLKDANDPVLSSVWIAEVSPRIDFPHGPSGNGTKVLFTEAPWSTPPPDQSIPQIIDIGIAVSTLLVVIMGIIVLLRICGGACKKPSALKLDLPTIAMCSSPISLDVLSLFPRRCGTTPWEIKRSFQRQKNEEEEEETKEEERPDFSGLVYSGTSADCESVRAATETGDVYGTAYSLPSSSASSGMLLLSVNDLKRLSTILQVEDNIPLESPFPGREGKGFYELWDNPSKLENIALGVSLSETAAAVRRLKGLYQSGGCDLSVKSGHTDLTIGSSKDVLSNSLSEHQPYDTAGDVDNRVGNISVNLASNLGPLQPRAEFSYEDLERVMITAGDRSEI